MLDLESLEVNLMICPIRDHCLSLPVLPVFSEIPGRYVSELGLASFYPVIIQFYLINTQFLTIFSQD